MEDDDDEDESNSLASICPGNSSEDPSRILYPVLLVPSIYNYDRRSQFGATGDEAKESGSTEKLTYYCAPPSRTCLLLLGARVVEGRNDSRCVSLHKISAHSRVLQEQRAAVWSSVPPTVHPWKSTFYRFSRSLVTQSIYKNFSLFTRDYYLDRIVVVVVVSRIIFYIYQHLQQLID